MSNDLMVEWMHDKLDADASLEDFAGVFARLFADTLSIEYRRSARLDLKRMRNSALTATKDCELSPVALQEFQRICDPGTPPVRRRGIPTTTRGPK